MGKKVECIECGKEFIDENYSEETPLIFRVYCNECLDGKKKK